MAHQGGNLSGCVGKMEQPGRLSASSLRSQQGSANALLAFDLVLLREWEMLWEDILS